MKKKDLQSLNEELFNSEEILSNELRELVEVVGGAATPATSKNEDCSSCTYDCTGASNDTSKYRTDSSAGPEGGTDTIRKDDGFNEQAAQAVLKAIDDYNKNSNGVVSGDLMEYEGPCCKEYY